MKNENVRIIFSIARAFLRALLYLLQTDEAISGEMHFQCKCRIEDVFTGIMLSGFKVVLFYPESAGKLTIFTH